MALRRAVFVAIVVAAVLVPATTASARHHAARLDLALVPLQSAQLGPKNASLALNYGSGPTSGSGLIIVVTDGSPRRSSSSGHRGGYALDYGDPFAGSTEVTDIRTSVEEYRSPAAATKALASQRFEDKIFAPYFLESPFVDVTVKSAKAEPVGQRRFGFLITQAAPNLNPIVRLDEQVQAGRFVLDLTVTAGSASVAKYVAPHLMRVLHRRLQYLLEGRLTGSHVQLLPRPTAGQAEGGPDLSTLILQPTDVGESHAVNLVQGYTVAPPALSDFFMILSPAGTYDTVVQQVGWWPTATEATYAEIYGSTDPFFALGFGFGYGGIGFGFGFGYGAFSSADTVTPVDLSSLDDPATGYIVTEDDGDSEALVSLTNGQAGEFVLGYKDNGTLQASDVLSLAQAAADRLDAGLGP